MRSATARLDPSKARKIAHSGEIRRNQMTYALQAIRQQSRTFACYGAIAPRANDEKLVGCEFLSEIILG